MTSKIRAIRSFLFLIAIQQSDSDSWYILSDIQFDQFKHKEDSINLKTFC
jgi:hypothetical protein